ncbi:hypothetical protein HMPREF0971_03184 [Segatella oris F0302]|uniref:Uncharacterized protein n=1 Tax=Segatella oris F0302 TaxID=649760 RepID=D1QVZ1_9BACT|nr:hypothetical protein HMPREF0971_03184 [Segatella oris F0302]
MRATFSVFFLFEFIKCMKFFGLKSIRRAQLHFYQLTLQILSHSCVIQNECLPRSEYALFSDSL